MGSDTLSHVHETTENLSTIELTPPHDPRTETPIYKAIHERLLFQEDRPCFTCGVRHSDLQDPARRADVTINPYGAKVMESHHVVVERSLANAVDPALVAKVYASVHQFKTFIEWVDGSEDNIKPFCDQCHRLADHAIHRAAWQDVSATRFGIRGPDGKPYQFVATAKDASQVEAKDEQIEQAAGMEGTQAHV